jgi:hypothetical protein
MNVTKTMRVAGAAGVLLASLATGARAETAADWSQQPKAAFVEAFVFACQPVEYDFAGARDPLKPTALAIYERLFVGTYHSNCRDFYFDEVVPRLDIDQRPHTPG